MARTKGTFFVALREFVIKKAGKEGWQDFLSHLPSSDRVEVDQARSSGWYLMEVRLRATHALVDHFRQDTSILSEFGRFEAEHDLGTVERLFLRMGSPAFAMEKASQYWRRFYDWGGLKVIRKSKGAASVEIMDSPFADEAYCLQFHAYMQRVFELVGAKDVTMQHTKCRGRGDGTCIFEGTWRP